MANWDKLHRKNPHSYRAKHERLAKTWFSALFIVCTLDGKPALLKVGDHWHTIENAIHLQWRGEQKRSTEYFVMGTPGNFETDDTYTEEDQWHMNIRKITKKQLSAIKAQIS